MSLRDDRPTPGPWRFDGVRVYAPAFDEQVAVEQKDGTTAIHGRGLIALPYSCGPLLADFGGHTANAALITAAPDLLDALRALVKRIDGSFERAYNLFQLPEIDAARAAIAKATGKL